MKRIVWTESEPRWQIQKTDKVYTGRLGNFFFEIDLGKDQKCSWYMYYSPDGKAQIPCGDGYSNSLSDAKKYARRFFDKLAFDCIEVVEAHP